MSSDVTFDYTHRVEGSVLVQDLTEWGGDSSALSQVESEWLDHASQPTVEASVTAFGPEVRLGRETQRHMTEEWSELATEAGIDRIAFVSEGAKAMAAAANLDVPQEVETFSDLDTAIEWAK